MASSIFHILSFILFHLLLASCARTPTGRGQTGFRATLTRVESGKTFPKYTSTSLVNNEPSASFIQAPMKISKDVYTMNLAIGTPPVTFSAMMDTGSDLIWTRCNTGHSYDSSKSKSFSRVEKSCDEYELIDCKQNYADGNSVKVSLGQETLKIGNENFNNVTFACGSPDKGIPYHGVIGMGRGDLSLVSQKKESVFLYCLGSREQKTSSVLLTGSKASSKNTNTQTTPLIKQGDKSYYYISLEGISVGETKLAVTKADFVVSSYGNGGMIIDSGTTFTYLEKRIVNMISDEFMNQTKVVNVDDKPYKGLENCFKPLDNVPVPDLVFHFEGADWVLKRQNYIYESEDKSVACLAFIANEEDNGNVSIFGNLNQQNMMVVYDLDNNNLSFKPAVCSTL